MKKFKWKIEFKYVKNKPELPKDDKQHFESIWINALQKCYKDGLGIKLHRTVMKISDKLEAAKDNFINLEDAEFTLIKEPFEKAKFEPQFTRMLNEIYDNIEEAEKEKSK